MGIGLMALLAGCGNPTGGDTTDAAANPTAITADAPATVAGLEALFTSGGYQSWRSEPAFHPTRGPHGSDVRVYYGPLAAASLTAGEAAFPAGAATVKEERSGGQLIGWSAWTKVTSAADGGRGFFWYELLRGASGDQTYGGTLGSATCTGCHAAGHDFLLSSGTFE